MRAIQRLVRAACLSLVLCTLCSSSSGAAGELAEDSVQPIESSIAAFPELPVTAMVSSAFLQVDASSLSSYLLEHPEQHVIVKYGTPSCSSTSAMFRSYLDAQALLGDKAVFFEFDCKKARRGERDFCQDSLKITRYPVLRAYHGPSNESFQQFNGPFDSFRIARFVEKFVFGRVFMDRDLSAVLAQTEKSNFTMVAILPDNKHELYSSFSSVAALFGVEFDFVVVLDPVIAQHSYNISALQMPALHVYRTFDKKKVVYPSSDYSITALESFFKRHMLALVSTWSDDLVEIYHSRGYPLILVFSDDDGHQSFARALRPLAKIYAGRASFFELDTRRQQHADRFETFFFNWSKDSSRRAVAAIWRSADQKTAYYKLDVQQPSYAKVRSFVDDVLAGRAHSFMQTAPW